MKSLLLFGVLIGGLALAQDDAVSVTPAAKEGEKQKFKLKLDLNVMGTMAEVKSNVVLETRKVTKEAVEREARLEELEVTLQGSPVDIPADTFRIIAKPSGELQEVTGGLSGSEPVRTYLLFHFFAPPKPLKKDETWTITHPKITDKSIPELKGEGTYLGSEEIAGKATQKFKIKFTEVGDEPFSSDSTFWVDKGGTIRKISGTFKGLPIPQAGASADGSVAAEAIH